MKICSDCNKAKYCQFCGEKLVVKRISHTYFDEDTGEKGEWHNHIWTCPKYNPLTWMLVSHTKKDDIYRS